ncbi:MAG TPA: hypothetical protein VK533_02080 [Sphingomonas sp.]|nr:hypothetical protein [Sphingomonas sp.]HMI18313.1 hypothetical protein [Sphingomonas sp.]
MNGPLVVIVGAMGGAAIGLLYVICAKVSQIVVILREIAQKTGPEKSE